MSSEIRFVGIPDKLIPLYDCPTASEVVRRAIDMIAISDINTQSELLSSPFFNQIVSQAIYDMDENRNLALNKIVNQFTPDLRMEAQDVFGF